jgi:hypothetical protein
VVVAEDAGSQAAARAADMRAHPLLLLLLQVGPMRLAARKAGRALSALGLRRLTTTRASIITTSMSQRAQRAPAAAAGTLTATRIMIMTMVTTTTTTTTTMRRVAAGRAQRRVQAPAPAQGAPLVQRPAVESAAAAPAAGRRLRRQPQRRRLRSGTLRAAVCPSA